MQKPEPQKEHQWLQKLVGEWTYESEIPMEPGKPPVKLTGTESVRSIGGLWIIAEGKGQTPDGQMGHNVMTIGFDPQKHRFVGTWLGSMMAYLWPYEGELDPTETVLTLNSVGADFTAPDRMTNFKDIIEIRDAHTRFLHGKMQLADGSWQDLMTVRYTRKA